MDPVREIEQLNIDEWRREEAAAGETIGEQVWGWLCVAVMVGIVAALGVMGTMRMVGAW